MNHVQKYVSEEGYNPPLTRLGSSEWERTKEKTKKAVENIARDLVKLYAERMNGGGISYSEDTLWQKELEASFLYADTPDQARTTREVKEDMERGKPMDRLICGDVGFGKTEVAVRAAFKAVVDGKQAAFLVPTTATLPYPAGQIEKFSGKHRSTFPFQKQSRTKDHHRSP